MISILEVEAIDSMKVTVMKLIDENKFQMALFLAGSLTALKLIYNAYKNKKIREKYLGKPKKNKSDGIMDWNDLVQNLSDSGILSAKK